MKRVFLLALLCPLLGCPERTAEKLEISSPPPQPIAARAVATRGRGLHCAAPRIARPVAALPHRG